MKPPPENSRLCHLIDDSLRHFTNSLEHSDLKISSKSEKQLLISLSKLFKQIQFWTNELDTDSDNVVEVKVPASNYKSSFESACCCDNHDCVTKIIGDMILLLSAESRFVQHLAGNILVAISDYFAASESYWDQFVNSLCICLELAISNALLCSLDRPQYSNHDMSHAIVTLQPRLKRATWFLVACVVRVLRTTLKRMKQDIDDELLQIYLNSVGACLANVPWDVMDQNWKAIRISGDPLEDKGGRLVSRPGFRN